MKNTKRSITFKVILGYLSIAALAGLGVWFIYTQVIQFSKLTRNNDLTNRQLVLVSEIATELYETESTGRRFIQSEDSTYFNKYSAQIDSIQSSIFSLKSTYTDTILRQELDSISTLLSQKGENLEELLQLRSRDRNTSYYREVIKELQKVDKSFTEPDYEKRFPNLKPYQRRALIKLLEFSKDENDQTSTITTDSLVKSVKKVLSELETENQQFRNIINKKENELLSNDMILNEQLRNLLNSVEHEERQTTLEKAQNSRIMLTRISRIIIIIGIASVLIILVFLLLITQDISRSQRYRLQLEETKAFTESLMKRREQFIAAITHDLRSPLNTVMGYSELMNKSRLNDKQHHYLDNIKKSSEFILHLVNDLLDLSKLDAGKMLIEKLPFNPKKLLEETIYSAIPENKKKNLQVTINASQNSDCQVISDPFRIKQLLSNLISNAYKFTEEGEIIASLSLEKEIENSYLMHISIKDSGIGISEEKQEEIFEEFSQEHQQIEKKYGGTGLGLAITKRITSLLKGTIKLVSSPGQGSEFRLAIPVLIGEEPVNKPAESNIAQKELANKKVLVVDDEASQLALCAELLKSVGMECDRAINGKVALEKLRNNDFDLVLTDIQMPEMDGFELLEAIQNDRIIQNIPVIAVSGRNKVDSEVYKKAGFQGNILKPFKPEALLQKIGAVLQVEIERKEIHKSKTSKVSPNYSLEEIKMFSGNDPRALETILVAFIESNKKNLKEIRTAYEIGDIEGAAKIAHRMLPMFKQLKAKEIVNDLEKMEIKEDEVFQEDNIYDLTLRIEVLLEELHKEITT